MTWHVNVVLVVVHPGELEPRFALSLDGLGGGEPFTCARTIESDCVVDGTENFGLRFVDGTGVYGSVIVN